MVHSQEAMITSRTDILHIVGLSSDRRKTVCVVGLGYIGLPTSAILATCGYHVWGVDVHPEVVTLVNKGGTHISEPYLDEAVRDVVSRGMLAAGTIPKAADVFFLCVPTPVDSHNEPDLRYVRAAAQSIRPYVRPGSLIILESTSPPGTTEEIIAREAVPEGLQIGRDVFVAYCPERVLPGNILKELVENDRIVGGVTPECTGRASEFYESFVHGRVHRTTAPTAELTKLVENSYRDVNIAFANEVSMLADSFGVDPFCVIELANKHPRVNILTPGPGVGGHCISVDPWFLVHADPKCTPLIRKAREVNISKMRYVIDVVIDLARDFPDLVIGCLGLTYKANVDDLRESPSLKIANELQERFPGRMLACDPIADEGKLLDLTLVSLDELLRSCGIIVLLTDHAEFARLQQAELGDKVVVDTRGCYRSQLQMTGRMLHVPLSLLDRLAGGQDRAA